VKAQKMGSNNNVLPPLQHPGDKAMQSGIDVMQVWYRVAVTDQEETIAQLVTPEMVWESLESFPHGGIYAGMPALFLPVLAHTPG
jgi:hypothetical protein